MPSDPDDASEFDPEARDALHQLKDGMRRARKIVREAQQAIAPSPHDGPILLSELPEEPEAPPAAPDGDGPIIPAD